MCGSPHNKIKRMGNHKLKREQKSGGSISITGTLRKLYTRRVGQFHWENKWKMNGKICSSSHKVKDCDS